jgi:hypothetical protein
MANLHAVTWDPADGHDATAQSRAARNHESCRKSGEQAQGRRDHRFQNPEIAVCRPVTARGTGVGGLLDLDALEANWRRDELERWDETYLRENPMQFYRAVCCSWVGYLSACPSRVAWYGVQVNCCK